MCKLLEEMRKEAAAEAEAKGRAENEVSTALKMLARRSYSLEEIADISGLALETVCELAEKETA